MTTNDPNSSDPGRWDSHSNHSTDDLTEVVLAAREVLLATITALYALDLFDESIFGPLHDAETAVGSYCLPPLFRLHPQDLGFVLRHAAAEIRFRVQN